MGLLKVGVPLSLDSSKTFIAYVRLHGIRQFLHIWEAVKDIENDSLKFGDEVEGHIFKVDHERKEVRVAVRSAAVKEDLDEKEKKSADYGEGVSWQPEFGAWMIESTPSRPYTDYASGLLRVEQNMRLRRRRLLTSLASDEISPTVTSFPRMGVGKFYDVDLPFDASSSLSEYVPDFVINPHPRFGALTRNIRARRGSKVDIRVPLFHDSQTPEFLRLEDPSSIPIVYARSDPSIKLEPDTSIHMDCMAFGMGMCSLQVTFQGKDVDESRYMYDQLAILSPIMMAMTAASPIYKGRLSDVDARWNVIAASVDDRTPAERGEVAEDDMQRAVDPLLGGGGVRRQIKSRYDSVSTYIYHCNGEPACLRTFERYNDIICPVDDDTKTLLLDAGIDINLAHHISHLFTRDPLVIFEGNVELDDTTTTEHFENIQSTNWQSCRWKPPPLQLEGDPHIGWRTELRTMEVQLTDFENAAFTVFVVLLNRVILAFDLALYVPISRVDENMQRAQKRDAARTEKFFFRRFMAPPDEAELRAVDCSQGCFRSTNLSDPADRDTWLAEEDCYEEMTLNEIFNGKLNYFPGLVPLIYAYLEHIECDKDPEVFTRLDQYLQFVAGRARGDLITCATWQRNFIAAHPSYRQDSVVSSEVLYDLLMACKDIGEGNRACPEVYGNVVIDKIRPQGAYGSILKGRLSSEERGALVDKLCQRANLVRAPFVARGTAANKRTDCCG